MYRILSLLIAKIPNVFHKKVKNYSHQYFVNFLGWSREGEGIHYLINWYTKCILSLIRLFQTWHHWVRCSQTSSWFRSTATSECSHRSKRWHSTLRLVSVYEKVGVLYCSFWDVYAMLIGLKSSRRWPNHSLPWLVEWYVTQGADLGLLFF